MMEAAMFLGMLKQHTLFCSVCHGCSIHSLCKPIVIVLIILSHSLFICLFPYFPLLYIYRVIPKALMPLEVFVLLPVQLLTLIFCVRLLVLYLCVQLSWALEMNCFMFHIDLCLRFMWWFEVKDTIFLKN